MKGTKDVNGLLDSCMCVGGKQTLETKILAGLHHVCEHIQEYMQTKCATQ